MVQLNCVIVDEGSTSTIVIDEKLSVALLKKEITADQKYEFVATKLRVFLAKDGGKWLKTSSDAAKQLQKRKLTGPVKALMHEDNELQGGSAINSALEGLDPPANNQIHVLVKLPETFAHNKRPCRKNTSASYMVTVKTLENVPRLNVDANEKYVTLPAGLLKACGLFGDVDLMLYCRPGMYQLWSYLRNRVVADNKRPLIVGPPGVGKSACVLSFAASLDRAEWSVIWIHLATLSSCFVMRTKESWSVPNIADFELPRVAGEKLFVFVDGYKQCDAHETLLANILARLGKEDRFVICSSMAAPRKRNAQDDALLHIERFFMYSWTQEEYLEAVSDDIFYAAVADKLDASSVGMHTEVNMEYDSGEEELSKEQRRGHAVKMKFYYAGGSCRLMFQYTTERAKEILHMALVYPKNSDLIYGFNHWDTTNNLSRMKRAELGHPHRPSPVSSFAAYLLSGNSNEEIIAELVTRFDDSDDPWVDRFFFEWLFMASVQKCEVKLFGAGDCIDVLPQARVLQFHPRKRFRKLTGKITHCYGDKTYDVVYADGEKDAHITAELIQLHGRDNDDTRQLEKGDEVATGKLPRIVGNRTWLQPLERNQAGFDALYFDTDTRHVIFVQVARSKQHLFKTRYFTDTLRLLQVAGLTNPSVEIYLVVQSANLVNFRRPEFDRTALAEFDQSWTMPEGKDVKVRAFKRY